MKKKSKLILITLLFCLLILILSLSFAAYRYIQTSRQARRLYEEIKTVEALLQDSSLSSDEITKVLNRRISSGDFLLLETSMKTHIRDLYDAHHQFNEILSDEAFLNALSPETMIQDGPDFTKTLTHLHQLKEKMANALTGMNHLLSQEGLASYKDADLPNYLSKEYDTYASSLQENHLRDELEDKVTEFTTKIDGIITILEFLKAHPKDWYVEGRNLFFTSDQLYEEYASHLEKLSDTAK